jgi:hypothetical protein
VAANETGKSSSISIEADGEAVLAARSLEIFAKGVGKALDPDSLYRRQMKEPLERAGIDWGGWHVVRRGLATKLERIGVRDSISAMVLRHTNNCVTRNHYIKPPSIEPRAAMRQLSETLSALGKSKLLPRSHERERESR